MYKSFYAGMDYAHLPLFALFFFLAVFVGVLVRTFVMRRPHHFDPLAQLPLDLPERSVPVHPSPQREASR